MLIFTVAHLACWVVVCGSTAFLLLAIHTVANLHLSPAAPSPPCEVTVMRPLCGDEGGLEEALESLLAQEVDDELVSFVFGVTETNDPAMAIARRCATRHPTRRTRFVVDAAVHGSNPKVSNLINMSAGGLAALVVLTDSDVLLPPGCLQRLIDAAAPVEVGAVTALFRGRPGAPATLASRLGALYLDGWFLPSALLHARLSGASVCYGQLTAIKRDVLPDGDLRVLADVLADDTELGHLTRRAGRTIRFAPDVVEAWVNDRNLPELFRHELRWARTIKALQPIGYAASIFMHPGPLPLVLGLLEPGAPTLIAIIALGLLRWVLVKLIHARLGSAPALKNTDPVTLWARDQLYFAVWICGFVGRHIVWRGRPLFVGPEATVGPATPSISNGAASGKPAAALNSVIPATGRRA